MILLIEDNEDNIRIIEKILTHHGHSVTTCQNAENAYQWCQQNTPKLIFMDISLPEMDGLVLTQKLRKLSAFANIPIIALSAYATDKDRQKGINAGCTDYLTKPFKPDQLIQKAEQYLTIKNESAD